MMNFLDFLTVQEDFKDGKLLVIFHSYQEMIIEKHLLEFVLSHLLCKLLF